MKLQILKYEMKKIFYKKSTIISLVGLVIFLAINLIPYVSQISYTYSDGSSVSGIKAIRLLRDAKMKWNGTLTVERIRKVLKENNALNSDKKYAGVNNENSSSMTEKQVKLSNMQYSKKQGFSDINMIIDDSFSKIHYFDYYLVDSLKPDAATKFYSNRVNQLTEFLSSKEANTQLDKNEHDYLINSAKTLTTPFKYSYADGWLAALEKSAPITFGTVFIVCILMAPLFSVEYQTGSDAILLSTEYGKKKGIIYKLTAGLFSISLVYWIASFIVYGIIFTIFGIEGGSCPIQSNTEGWKSFYHITNSQALLMVVILGYLASLFIGVLAMFLSSKVKSSFVTIVVLVLILLIPAIIGKSLDVDEASQLGKILSVFPDQMLTGWNSIQTWILYDIGGKVRTPYDVLPILYGVLTVILLPLSYNAFRKHQIA